MKTVMVFGTFDILHIGHIKMLEQARKHGDYLIATIARDVNVKRIKGVRPFHTEDQRKEMLKNIKLIDRVCMGNVSDVYAIIRKYKPDVIALGYDQTEFVDGLKNKIEEYDWKSKIVRLKPYQEQKYKTNKVKKYLGMMI